MNVRPAVVLVTCLVLAGVGTRVAARQDDDPPPRILLDQSPRAVEYQLDRLSDAQLSRVERNADDPRYIPVYQAILRRPGLDAALRDEALTALVALEQSTVPRVLLDALSRTSEPAEAAPLVRRLASLPAVTLAADAAAADALIDDGGTAADAPAVRGAWIVRAGAGGDAAGLVARAEARGQRVALFDALADLGAAARTPTRAAGAPEAGAEAPGGANAAPVAAAFVPHLRQVVDTEADVQVRAAAIGALGALAPDVATFGALAGVAAGAPDAIVMAALVDAVAGMPESAWASDSVEELARAIVDWVGRLDPAARTEPAAIDAMALADVLAGAVPTSAAAALRGELRALGVRVVRIETLFEQVAFDRRWFVVEAGRPVQIVFFNPDAMPHNVVIGAPGSLEKVGTEGGAMPLPDDPAVKPFVPDIPEVIAATDLIKQDETARLSLTAPDTPGDYIFVCTFPGHWVRMYGVMRVVDDLAAWEADPVVPADPMTGQPFE